MATQTIAPATTWEIDSAHSSAQFKVRHLMVSNVRGEFAAVRGKLVFDPQRPEASSVEATIDVSSINTREAQRDAHLKSADFFEVEKYPAITFRSTKVAPSEDGLSVTGDLTIHGVTRPVVLEVEGPTAPVKDPWGSVRIGASARTKINRKDFGLTWNAALETGGVLVGEEVSITIDIEATQK